MVLVRKEGRDVYFIKEKEQIKLDLKTKLLFKKTETRDWYPIKNANLFFQRLGIYSLKFEDENLKKFIYKLHSIFMGGWVRRFTNLSSLLTIGFPHYYYLQEYTNEDLDFQAYYDRDYNGWKHYNGITEPLHKYDSHIIEGFKKYELKFNTIFEKYYFEIYMYGANSDIFIKLFQYLNNLERTPNVKFINDIINNSYVTSNFLDIIKTYNYDVILLFEYIEKLVIRYKHNTNNYPSNLLSKLRDYLIMLKQMEVKKYDRFPEDLFKAHDNVVKNFYAVKDSLKDRDWVKMLESKDWKKFEFKDKEYCIIYPKLATDVAKEGCSQNNCVKSYIDNVLRGSTEIVFMREVGKEDESLITVEVGEETPGMGFTGKEVVTTKGGYRIRQREGKNRRKLTEEELLFLNKYSKYLKQ